MSVQEYTTVRRLKLHEIVNNPTYKNLVRRYAETYCTGAVRVGLLKLAA
jgi:hypothetical protein